MLLVGGWVGVGFWQGCLIVPEKGSEPKKKYLSENDKEILAGPKKVEIRYRINSSPPPFKRRPRVMRRFLFVHRTVCEIHG